MQRAWAKRDLDEMARLAHWMKGAGGTAGFDAADRTGHPPGARRQGQAAG